MKNTTYNGWSNYATWRVNLEFFSGGDFEDYLPLTKYDVATDLKEIVEDHIVENSTGYAQSYARAFLDDVDWIEIASHYAEGEDDGH